MQLHILATCCMQHSLQHSVLSLTLGSAATNLGVICFAASTAAEVQKEKGTVEQSVPSFTSWEHQRSLLP